MKRIIVVVTLFLMYGCNQKLVSIYTNQKSNHTMEKLNIKELKNIKTNIISSKQNISNKKDSNINVLKASVTSNGENLNYSYDDLENNIRVFISGNESNGYLKKEKKINDPTYERISEFYPNGNLKFIGEKYISKKGAEPDGLTRSIGRWYRYDENENIINTIEYDESDFKFTLKDVQEYLALKNYKVMKIIKRASTVIDGKKATDAVWVIEISEQPGTVTGMTIDPITGKVLAKGKPQKIKIIK